MLADAVAVWIEKNHLKQAQAAEILRISRPRVSDLVRNQVGKFSVDTLMDLVFRTGKSVTVHVR
jgi:predicted XRE-type DNA-binding protein